MKKQEFKKLIKECVFSVLLEWNQGIEQVDDFGNVSAGPRIRMHGPEEEAREIQIGRQILDLLDEPRTWGTPHDVVNQKIKKLAEELIKLHKKD